MRIIELYYEKVLKKDIPYYAKYSLGTIIMKPIIKFFNIVIIPNVPFLTLRVALYRLVGFKLGKDTDIGMKCYLDEINPSLLTMEENVTVSCNCYFTCHGKGQSHTPIHIKEGSYIGMCVRVVSGKKGVTIGKNAIVGAGSLVVNDVPDNATVVGVPAKVVKIRNA